MRAAVSTSGRRGIARRDNQRSAPAHDAPDAILVGRQARQVTNYPQPGGVERCDQIPGHVHRGCKVDVGLGPVVYLQLERTIVHGDASALRCS